MKIKFRHSSYFQVNFPSGHTWYCAASALLIHSLIWRPALFPSHGLTTLRNTAKVKQSQTLWSTLPAPSCSRQIRKGKIFENTSFHKTSVIVQCLYQNTGAFASFSPFIRNLICCIKESLTNIFHFVLHQFLYGKLCNLPQWTVFLGQSYNVIAR